MNNQMLDGNSAAEINHDESETEIQEYRRELKEAEAFRRYRDDLLAGRKVYSYIGIFDLNERIINKYSEMLKPDFEFVEAYKRGTLHPDIRRFVEREADYLASKIVDA